MASPVTPISKEQIDSLEITIRDLSYKVDSLTKASYAMGIRSDFFSDAMTNLTTIFSVIITVTLAIIALLSWQFFLKPFSQKIERQKIDLDNMENRLKSDFATFSNVLEDRIMKSESSLSETAVHAAFSVYQISKKEANNATTLLWLLHLIDTFPDLARKIVFIKNSFAYLTAELNERSNHEEIKRLLEKLTSVSDESFKAILKDLDLKYHMVAFSNPQSDPNEEVSGT